jgi:hypothetical protein
MASNQQTLNAKQKKELCQAREKDPKLKYEDLVKIAEEKFGFPSRSRKPGPPSPCDLAASSRVGRRVEHISPGAVG